MPHSEQKCTHFCSEWCIVGYKTDALWDLWIRPSKSHNASVLYPTMHHSEQKWMTWRGWEDNQQLSDNNIRIVAPVMTARPYYLIVCPTGDLVDDFERRRQLAMAAYAARLKREREAAAILLAVQQSEIDDDLPPFARPFRKQGAWVHRPPKPRYSRLYPMKYTYHFILLVDISWIILSMS